MKLPEVIETLKVLEEDKRGGNWGGMLTRKQDEALREALAILRRLLPKEGRI